MDKAATNGVAKTDSAKKEWQYSRVELYLESITLSADKLKPTPSEKDGLDELSEYDLRYTGCELIQTAGILLKLPQVAMATAQVLFQRYYYFKSFVNNPMEIFAMASLVLASKIEEAVRRNRDIINVFHYLKFRRANLTPEPLTLDGNYQYIKSQVIKAERKLLRELGFCVHVKHPHKLITVMLQALSCERHRVLLQTAWNYMNDGLRTDIFVRFTPETIACACIYLAARQHKVALPIDPPWYEVFKCNEQQLNEISHTLLYLYVHQPQSVEQLDETLQKLKEKINENKAKSKLASLNAVVSAAAASNGVTTPLTQSMNQSPNSKAPSPSEAKDPKKLEKLLKNASRPSSENSPDDHRHSPSNHSKTHRHHSSHKHSRKRSKEVDRGSSKHSRHKKHRSRSPPVSPKRRRTGSSESSVDSHNGFDRRSGANKKHKKAASRDSKNKKYASSKSDVRERNRHY